MTGAQMVQWYVQEIMRTKGAGFLPRGYKDDPEPMQIAKLQDALVNEGGM